MVLARFGQIVIGPPGSGKTTYVTHMADLLRDGEKKLPLSIADVPPFLSRDEDPDPLIFGLPDPDPTCNNRYIELF